jgi:hypothetical protein
MLPTAATIARIVANFMFFFSDQKLWREWDKLFPGDDYCTAATGKAATARSTRRQQ